MLWLWELPSTAVWGSGGVTTIGLDVVGGMLANTGVAPAKANTTDANASATTRAASSKNLRAFMTPPLSPGVKVGRHRDTCRCFDNAVCEQRPCHDLPSALKQ